MPPADASWSVGVGARRCHAALPRVFTSSRQRKSLLVLFSALLWMRKSCSLLIKKKTKKTAALAASTLQPPLFPSLQWLPVFVTSKPWSSQSSLCVRRRLINAGDIPTGWTQFRWERFTMNQSKFHTLKVATFQLPWKVRLEGSLEVGVFNEFPERVGWFDGVQSWTAATESWKGDTLNWFRFVIMEQRKSYLVKMYSGSSTPMAGINFCTNGPVRQIKESQAQ